MTSDDAADDEELAEIIRDRQARAARAKVSNVPMLLDPKLILDFIDLWHKDPNTPLPELNLTPGQSHVLTHFIDEEKWKFEQGRSLKKAQYKKQATSRTMSSLSLLISSLPCKRKSNN